MHQGVMMYANDFASGEHRLCVSFISQRGQSLCSDAFLFDADGSVVLLDSGLPELPYAKERILELRKSYLKDSPSLCDDESVKIRVTWIASHMHTDHVGAFIEDIVKCPYIHIEKVFLPPETSYFPPSEGKEFADFLYRKKIAENLRTYQKEAEVITIPFSKEELSFSSGGVSFSLLPPPIDWGSAERVSYSEKVYEGIFYTEEIGVLNSNSMWLLAEYENVRFLFTGDSIKKTLGKEESFDLMLSVWKDRIKDIDVLKYPHHGIMRDEAAEAVLSLNAKYIVYNAIGATAPDALRKIRPSIDENTTLLSSADEDVVFSVSSDGILVTCQSKCKAN